MDIFNNLFLQLFCAFLLGMAYKNFLINLKKRGGLKNGFFKRTLHKERNGDSSKQRTSPETVVTSGNDVDKN